VSYMDNYRDKFLGSHWCVCLTWTITQTSCFSLTGVCILHGQLHRQIVVLLQVCVSYMDNYTTKLFSYRCVSYMDNYKDRLVGSFRCACLACTITQTSCSFTSVCVLHGQLHRQIVPFKVCVSYMDNYTDKLLGSYRCACFTWTITQTSCWVLTGVCVQHGQLHRQVVNFEVCMSDIGQLHREDVGFLQVCVSSMDNYTDKLFFYKRVCLTWTITQTNCSL
jgi:hypothetical protein